MALEGGVDMVEEVGRRRGGGGGRRRIWWLHGRTDYILRCWNWKVSLPVHGRISTAFLLLRKGQDGNYPPKNTKLIYEMEMEMDSD